MQVIPTHGVVTGDGAIKGVVMEIVIKFALVYTVYAAAADTKKGSLGTIAPNAIGFIAGANILAFGPFSGGSMNPACSFEPAVSSDDYSASGFIGLDPSLVDDGGLAGLIYANAFMSHEHDPLLADF